jgi:hypothetical protein
VNSTVAGATLADTCTGECLKSGPWGLAIILLLCIGCYFLFKSMSKHLKRVRERFPSDDAAAAGSGPGAGPDPGAGPGAGTDGAAPAGPSLTKPTPRAGASGAPGSDGAGQPPA